jgi:hypothetical protein
MRLAPLILCLALACGGDDDDAGGSDASNGGSDAGSSADAGGGGSDAGGDRDAGNSAVMCGGLTGLQCDDTDYCDWPDESCGGGDGIGECKRRPADCGTPEDDPVCGCNGRPYNNPCEAAMAGEDVGGPENCVSTSQATPVRSL